MPSQMSCRRAGPNVLRTSMAISEDKKTTFAPLPVPGMGPGKPKEVEVEQEIVAPKLESAVGIDYIPLLTALQLQEFDVADQLTRDLLLEIGGEQIKKQGFVYFAQVKLLPVKDMLTIDNLWVAYSRGKFGYSVQKKIWNGKKVVGDFNKFVQEIVWTKSPCGGCEGRPICSGCTGTLKRWTPLGNSGNEYSYDLKTAPKGHLPLTSALRGTYLIENLLKHPAFGDEKLETKFAVKAGFADNEKRYSMEELRFPPSPYSETKAIWDV